jgi:tetratricopeptide (TPR) repeat protein
VSKRLAALEKMTAAGHRGTASDTLTWYGLAMEYRSLGRVEDAEKTFVFLRQADPDYVPMYYQAGSLLLEAGRRDEARVWLEQGIATARRKGDTHALGELQTLLDSSVA